MKTIKLLLVLLLTSLSASAQWEKQYFVDDFGDNTSEYYYSLTSTGTFSNSAVQDAKLLGVFIHSESKKNLYIKVYEYETRLATHYKNTFESAKLKTPSGNIVTIKGVFFTDNGLLFFHQKRYDTLIKHIKEKGDYKLVFNRTTGSMGSSYKLSFTIN